MRKITPRKPTIKNIKEAIGKVTYTNLSPTMKARLVSCDIEKSYFEVLPHEKHTKYNYCAGQIFYLPTQMSISLSYLEE
jgi:hypothetical protein